MRLHALLLQFDPGFSLSGIPDAELGGIQEDSRKVRPGDLFVARPGTKTDGARFAADAAGKGAAAVVTATPLAALAIPQVIVADVGRALSALAQIYHGRPSRTVKVLGITGTNGKTTTTYLIRHLLARYGRKCGLVGTVEIDDGRAIAEATMTTPGAVELADLLARMRDNGCAACAIEVSSHALDQGRAAGIEFAGAGFTNLTGDHQDYHGPIENYAAAKARLFEGLAATAVAAVNAEDVWSARMVRDCGGRIVRWGFSADADYRACDVAPSAQGTHFVLATPDGSAEVSMGLIGRYNIQNALLAATLAGEVMGLSVHQIARGLADAAGAPGRLQPVRCGQPFTVLVDYAHTDDALENVLGALKRVTQGKLRVLFGCGGDRDRTKRPRMAGVAERLADVVYVTSDNPRSENPRAIIEEICAGFSPAARQAARVEPDRRAAIETILSEAAEGDVVLLAGKGHETYQQIGTEKLHFEDAEEAQRFLGAKCRS